MQWAKQISTAVACAAGFAAAIAGVPLLWVGVAALAYVLGRRLWSRRKRRPARRTLRFTREGRYLVAITLGIGFAAVNTGNNLLFLILGMLLSLIVVSGILSEHTLRGLTITRELPRQVHAGRAFLTGITLHNPKRRLPSFSIQVEDVVEGRPVAKKCYFLKIPAGSSQQTSYRSEFPRRGAHAYEGLQVSTRFPFGFFTKARRLEAPATLVVLPRVREVAQLPLPIQALLGELVQPRRGGGREFHGLRDHRPGDDARDVHWKRSAREGRLVLREYASQGSRRLLLFVNDRVHESLDVSQPAVVEALDECCELAASLLVHLTRRGFSVELATTDRTVPVDAEGRGLPEAMHLLALLTFHPAAPDTEPARPARAEAGVLISHRGGRHLVAARFAHVFEPGA